MQYGLTFNGKHSSEYGLKMLTLDRPILPEPKIITEEDANMDGDFDFSEVNPDSEIKYKNRLLEVEFTLLERDIKSLRNKARQIASWLACGEKQLIFDDQPDVYYLGKVVNKLSIENLLLYVKRFVVQFSCRPFIYQVQDTQDLIYLDSDILLDSDIRLDDEYSFEITGNTTVQVNNFGTKAVKPVIEVFGTFSTLSIASGEKSFNYNEAISNETLIIDNYKMQVTKGADNKNNKATGDFIVLPVGINDVQISGTGLNCIMKFIFRPLYY